MKTLEQGRCAFRLAILATCLVMPNPGNAAQPAELVVLHANVVTVDTKQRAQAFAVIQGRFVAVGSTESVREYIDPNTRVLDLPGRTIVPGFIDAHAHPGPEYPEDSPWA